MRTILGLRAVDLVAEDPAAGGAVGVHLPAAIVAFAAGRDAGDEHAVARLERRDAGADLVDDADAFVAENAARRAGRDVALEDVQVGAADGGLDDFDDGVARRADFGLGSLFERFFSGSVIDERFHESLLVPRREQRREIFPA